MEKTPKEYFVKVDVKEELPTSEGRYHVIKKIGDEGFTLLDSSTFYKDDNKFSSSRVTHWLKPLPSMPEQEWVSNAIRIIKKNMEYNEHEIYVARYEINILRNKLLNK